MTSLPPIPTPDAETLNLVCIEWNEDAHYYVKGHVDLELFRREVRSELGLRDTDDPGARHAYLRTWPDKSVASYFRVSEENGPGRGVFKATVTWDATESPSHATREAWRNG